MPTNHRGGRGTKVDKIEDQLLFDTLPRSLRNALNYSLQNFAVCDVIREYERYGEAAVLEGLRQYNAVNVGFDGMSSLPILDPDYKEKRKHAQSALSQRKVSSEIPKARTRYEP